MTTFQGASDHQLLSNWVTWLQDQAWTWGAEARTIAARAQWLVCNDPFCAALYAAHAQGLFGPLGPRLTSMYDPAPEVAGTTDATHALRRRITAIAAATWSGRTLDAEGVRSRRELEEALDWMAFTLGDGFAVRVTKRGKSRWRLIHPDRVANPKAATNTPDMRDGFRLVDGEVVGLWVQPSTFYGAGVATTQGTAQYIPWTAADGTPNVIHVPGFRLPGMLRGVSRLAPMIVMERQVGEVLVSHTAAKRLQAIYAMIVEAEDPDAWKAAQEAGTALTADAAMNIDSPLCVFVKPPGSKVDFSDTKFNGADLDAFLSICYKVQCAVLQLAVDVVLCQMGNASLSSARAGLDQFDRTNQTEQERHISACTSVIDRVAVADAQVAGLIDLPSDDPALVMVGKYSRPPKYSTDRLKDANTVAALLATAVSGTTAFETVLGLSWEDEQELLRAERAFKAAQAADESAASPASGAGAQPTPAPPDSGDAAPAPEGQPAASAPWWRRLLSIVRGQPRLAA